MAKLSLSDALDSIKENPEKFYAYVLLRPDGRPFYVGMGKRRRVSDHERYAYRKQRDHKSSIIRKIHDCGGMVGYYLSFFETRQQATDEERRLILLYGRIDIKTGPLTNRSEGGDGGSRGPKTSALSSAAQKRLWADPAYRKKICAAMRQAAERPERLAQISAASTGRKHSAEARAKISEGNKKWKRSPDLCVRYSEIAQAAWDDPYTRSRIVEGSRRAAKQRRGIKLTAEHKKKVSETLKGRVLSPEHREHIAEAKRANKARRVVDQQTPTF